MEAGWPLTSPGLSPGGDFALCESGDRAIALCRSHTLLSSQGLCGFRTRTEHPVDTAYCPLLSHTSPGSEVMDTDGELFGCRPSVSIFPGEDTRLLNRLVNWSPGRGLWGRLGEGKRVVHAQLQADWQSPQGIPPTTS